MISVPVQGGRRAPTIQCIPCGGKRHRRWVGNVDSLHSCSSFVSCFPNPEWNSGLVIFFPPSLQKWHAATSLYYWMDLFPMPSIGKGKTYYGKHRSHYNFVCWIYIDIVLFSPHSMFGRVELDSLNPCRVDYVNIKVVANLEGPFMWDLASS